jgi:dephospho-CoA kinase
VEETTPRNRPLVVGLTGNIAAGKSAVARLFGELGAALIDADELAREVVAPGGELWPRLRAEFGPAIFGAYGALDRAALGRLVFADPAARRRLEALTHPAIVAAAERRIVELASACARIVIYEAALLVETGRYRELDLLLVVVAEDALRLARLMARSGLDRGAAEARLRSQLPQAEKAALADYVIDNNGTMEHTRAQVERVWRAISRLRGEEDEPTGP